MRDMTPEGGPAFPVVFDHGEYRAESPRMSLRDWFAGQERLADWDHPGAVMSQATAEALAGPKNANWRDDPIGALRWEAKWRAAIRYIRADAMLAERSKAK